MRSLSRNRHARNQHPDKRPGGRLKRGPADSGQSNRNCSPVDVIQQIRRFVDGGMKAVRVKGRKQVLGFLGNLCFGSGPEIREFLASDFLESLLGELTGLNGRVECLFGIVSDGRDQRCAENAKILHNLAAEIFQLFHEAFNELQFHYFCSFLASADAMCPRAEMASKTAVRSDCSIWPV